jgi:glycyl-tRNA synthetase beta chain
MSDRLASGATTKMVSLAKSGAADFLLELRCEEIPARMQAGARASLKKMFEAELADAEIRAEAIEVYSTPRRLALIARDLPLGSQARSEEIKGPRTSAPDQAVEGFLRKTGLKREQLEERNGVYFAVVDTPGQATKDLLGPMIERIVRDFPWPKSMRWGEASASTESLRWVRPLHGIVALLGEEIVRVAIDGIESGAATLGHRFHHAGQITIGGAHDYAQKLRACHVIVDQAEREAMIRDGAAEAAKAAELKLVEDEGLVVENAGLTEWPVALLGRFEEGYLDVPREVIVLTMRANQKYFACTGKTGALAPAFVCIANVDASDGGEAIIEGNRRVLAARLADARFFWEQDLKVPLEEQAKKLGGIVFHEKLGTIADKVERLAKLARWLSEEGIVKDADPAQVERAARLAKADLVTGMVGEFPELQGVVGGYLARAQGEPAEIADAVRDHYGTPAEPISVAVALADKIDTVVSFFLIGEKPTGSKDPFAVRRAALSVIQMILENNFRLALLDTTETHVDAVQADSQKFRMEQDRKRAENAGVSVGLGVYATGKVLKAEEVRGRKFSSTSWDLLDFFADRLKVQQREAGVRHDLIDAVFALGGEDDLVRLLARVKALQAFVETKEGADLLTAYKRAANILKREKWGGGDSPARNDEVLREEQALIDALDKAEPRASNAVEAEDFTGAMEALASLRKPIDAFFDNVTVNVEDPGARADRLDLLMRFRDAVHRVADFSKIEA